MIQKGNSVLSGHGVRLPIHAGTMLCGVMLHSSMALAEPAYEQLIEQARHGDHGPALTFLRQAPTPSPQQRLDHLLIASWAGLDDEVIRLYEQEREQLSGDAEAQAAAARAYRDLQKWPEALDAYRHALSLAPGREDLQLALTMTLADTGRSAEAIAQAREAVQRSPADADRRLALGYALMRDGQHYAALAEFDRARDLAPERTDIQREYLFALQRAGLPVAARSLAQQRPELLDAAELRRLECDIVAEQVRLADTATRRESERYAIADRAIAQADRLLAAWQPLAEAEPDRNRLRIDRLGALHARARMQEVVGEYRQLQAARVALPPYALRWVAGALLYRRQPQEAAQLYRQVIDSEGPKDPEWMTDHQGLLHALVESESFGEAEALGSQLAEQQPPRQYPAGVPDGVPNDDWLEAQILLANALLYADETPAAQAAFERLSATAPNNIWLRTGLASVYQARGWPRRAESQLKIAESTAPRDLVVEVEQGRSALELQEWRQLDLLADDVARRFPENLTAQRLNRLRRVQRMAELRVSGYRGERSGSNVTGRSDYGVDSVLYSPPLNDDWRLFGGSGYAQGKFPEGRGHHRWVRTGVERRVRDNTLEAEVSTHDYGHGERPGVRLSGIHDLGDLWQYGWSAEVLSRDTPLRALNSDIHANGLSNYLRWRASERREWQLFLSATHFSDGNDRQAVLLDGRERLYTTANLALDLGLELAGSHNGKGSDVPYFNPKADFSALPNLNLSHILHRQYETVWSQQVQIAAGNYSQRDYGSGVMGLVGYGQRLRFDDRFDGGFLLTALSRPYDDQRQLEYRLVFDLALRF